jgi:NhaP-type Na+/H+ or K+/H+ antiporter
MQLKLINLFNYQKPDINKMGETIVFGALIMLFFVVLYHVIGNYIKNKNLIFGHEGSIIVVIGMVTSLILDGTSNKNIVDQIKFDPSFFFYGCLPPIIFSSVYNMDSKVFFDNFSAVIIFGVIGTILQFSLFSLGLWLLNLTG